MTAAASRQVFISYSARDKDAAGPICTAMEAAGISCWIAPRDLSPGGQWGGGIVAAIEACQAVLVVFSAASNDSPQVAREMELAVSKRRPLIPVRIEDVMPTHDMQYFLGVSHWFNAFPEPIEHYLPDLVTATQKVLQGQARAWSSFASRLPKKPSLRVALAAGALLLVATPVIGSKLFQSARTIADGSTLDLRPGANSAGARSDGMADLTRAVSGDSCDSPAPPGGPPRDIDGLYPGMKFSVARNVLLCRYPDLTQEASSALYSIAGGASAKLRHMTFRYPPVGGRHRGGEFKLIYGGDDGDGVVLYVSHLHYFDERDAPLPDKLLGDFVARYGSSTRPYDTQPKNVEAIVYASEGGKPLVNPPPVTTQLGGLSPSEAQLLRTRLEFERKLAECRSAVTGSRFTMEDICGLAVGIRLTQSGQQPPSAVLLTSFDMALTRKQALGS